MQIDIFGSFLRKVKDEYRDSVREVESSKKGQRSPMALQNRVSEESFKGTRCHTHRFFPPMVFGEPACQSVLIGSDSRGFR